MQNEANPPKGKRRLGTALYALGLAIITLLLVGMDGQLLWLGGSPYFVLAGLALAGCHPHRATCA